MAPVTVVSSWLAWMSAVLLTLMAAVLGQGVGALFGGCSWIGVSLPIHRQVWSLVNEPNLAFAAGSSAISYWLGSLLLPLLLAAAAVPLLPRRRSHGLEMLVVQLAWACAAVGVAWLPLLDREDGHVLRWLELHELPACSIWVLPVVAGALAVAPTLHLLSLARAARTNPRRSFRLAVVLVHLVLPLAGWVAFISSIRGGPPLLAIAALGGPVLAATATAWIGFPSPYVHELRALSMRTIAGLALCLVVTGAATWSCGRPLGDGHVAGLLWGRAGTFDNIRPWIEPAAALGRHGSP